jgi:transaldolase
MNPLLELRKQGQSIWLDYIRRDLIRDGGLKQLIDNDGLRGVTSNPSIFEKAIDGGPQYDEALPVLFAQNPDVEPRGIYDELSIEDVRSAADMLRPAYEESAGADGFVSIEPPPQLTRDAKETIREGQRLWRTVNRPNLMIKVVATSEGIQAVEALIAAGINVNITLMFSLSLRLSGRSARRRRLHYVERSPLRIQREFTDASVKSFMAMISQCCGRRERAYKDPCGRVRARRIPATVMYCTSKNSSGQIL